MGRQQSLRATSTPLRFCVGLAFFFLILLGRDRSVVSNASIWDTLRLVPKGALPEDFVKEKEATPQCKSFMHVSPLRRHAFMRSLLKTLGKYQTQFPPCGRMV